MNMSPVNVSNATAHVGVSAHTAPPREPQKLTESQKAKVNETLASYDPENLNAKDVAKIKETFKEEGILPSKELKDQVEEQGFDADVVVPAPEEQGAMVVPQKDEGMAPKAVQGYESVSKPSDESELALNVLEEIRASAFIEVPPSLESLIEDLRSRGDQMTGNLIDVTR